MEINCSMDQYNYYLSRADPFFPELSECQTESENYGMVSSLLVSEATRSLFEVCSASREEEIKRKLLRMVMPF